MCGRMWPTGPATVRVFRGGVTQLRADGTWPIRRSFGNHRLPYFFTDKYDLGIVYAGSVGP